MSSVISRGKKFSPRPEKKGRNLQQIEEQFRMLDEKEKRINEYYDERKLNVGRPSEDEELSFILTTSANVNLHTSNFWDVIKEKQETTSNKYHGMKSKEKIMKKSRKLIEVPDTLVHYRSPLHIHQVEKKKAFLKTSTPPNETKPVSNVNLSDHLQDESINSEGISLMDRTALEEVDRSQESSTIPSPVFKVTSPSSDLNHKLGEVFSFEIRVHQLAEHSNTLFEVKIYDEHMPIERVTLMKDLRINRDAFIIFTEPNMIKFNALTLPWVESPEDLINQTLVVEVQGTYPSRTRVAKSSIKFSHKSQPTHHEKPKIQIPPLRDVSFSRSRSPSPTQREKSNRSLLDVALPYSVSPARTNEEELKRSLSCQAIQPPPSNTTPPVEEEEDAVQRKLERMNSIEGPLSPSSQRYRELQFMRENMKLNLKLHQKLLS
ncbi:hypothetical protein FDP41_003249 [Naegleria fowleri]|uniref:Uncharacterized protein n=1 Tax=Naegleria fowleri TaxID=5763 RepID=A0A6A5BLN0_NAEFO|nr:uncharacterized protein FDP41_003249 [Naegleria fowleri]KAF0977927.1 hypothetical protein FDP41_003249 [Naegleria fowleri]